MDDIISAMMNRFSKWLAVSLTLGMVGAAAPAQTEKPASPAAGDEKGSPGAALVKTEGSVSLTATLGDPGGRKGTKHWTVVWVTNATTGAFVRTIRRQGPEYKSHWGKHCGSWYDAVAGNEANAAVAKDGFTSTTASSYAAPDNPFTQTWDCKDADGNIVPDGKYKIWIQYACDAKTQGPLTTDGMAWTKGPSPATVKPANQGTNFTDMSIVWKPAAAKP